MSVLLRRIVLAAVLLVELATCEPVRHAIKESIEVPKAWSMIGRAPKDERINLQIGLKQKDFQSLERRLLEVSDPSHVQYGLHLSQAEIDALVRPSRKTESLVRRWLLENGIFSSQIQTNVAGDWITVSIPVNQAETLLHAQYSVYRHRDEMEMIRTSKWSLPLHLHDHIDTIQPTTSFLRSSPEAADSFMMNSPGAKRVHHPALSLRRKYFKSPTVAQVCNTNGVTPLCLRTLYGTLDYQPQVPGKNKVGLTDYLGESNNRSDIHIFLEQFRPEAAEAAYQFEFEVINNGPTYQTLTEEQIDAGVDFEGNLDAETIIGIDWPTPLIAYTTGGSAPFKADNFTPTDTNEPYLDWVTYVNSLPDSEIPQTISTSYGDDEQTVPPAYAKRVCDEFAKLGARGVSLLFGSGDYGVGYNDTCSANDGRGTPTFLPSFPASCPYVTTVGATMGFGPEVVAFDPSNGFASGGGFSNYFTRPAYQDRAVSAYLDRLGGEFAPWFNANGRAYPDVSAQGVNYSVVWNGSDTLADGTSASTPTVSAIIALVNDALIAAGRSPLGFLNPWLYGGGYKAFTDVTSGSAIGCSELGSGLGFPATQGWDPVSGFGTPRFRDILASLNVKGRWNATGGWSCY